MKNNKIISLLLGVSIISIGLTGCSSVKQDSVKAMTVKTAESGGNMINVGKKALNFELKDTNGKIHKLSDYAGKKVYIKFWASWCSICLAGLDEVETLASKDNGFIVLSVVTPGFRGEKSSESFTKWFNSLGKNNLTVLLDDGGVLSTKLEVRGYPTSVFIGSDGVLVKKMPGQNSNEEIQNIFKMIK